MNTIVSILSLIGVIVLTLSDTPRAYADETYLVSPVMYEATARFTNENWGTLLQPTLAEFTVRDDGSAFGLTVTGIPFVQYNVQNELDIRVQRFEMQDHYHYIVNGEISNTLEELSVKLALAYEMRTGA